MECRNGDEADKRKDILGSVPLFPSNSKLKAKLKMSSKVPHFFFFIILILVFFFTLYCMSV